MLDYFTEILYLADNPFLNSCILPAHINTVLISNCGLNKYSVFLEKYSESLMGGEERFLKREFVSIFEVSI